MSDDVTRVPIPDPTILTTVQLNREIAALKEVVFTRLDGMDKALNLVNDVALRVPSAVDSAISHLRDLHEEKFKSIALQFSERDTRSEQGSRDSKVAVDAALQAAKEAFVEQNKSSALAIAKSESATMKQIDQLGAMIQTTYSGTNDKIDDIKSRLTLIEGKGFGVVATNLGHQTSSSFVVALVVAGVAVAGFVLMLIDKAR